MSFPVAGLQQYFSFGVLYWFEMSHLFTFGVLKSPSLCFSSLFFSFLIIKSFSLYLGSIQVKASIDNKQRNFRVLEEFITLYPFLDSVHHFWSK